MLKKQHGLSASIILVLISLFVLVGVSGWYVWQHRQAAKDPGTISTVTPQPKSNLNFYDCFDKGHGFDPGIPQTCTYQGIRYTRPADFTTDDIRDFDKVPTSARPTVLNIAKTNFDKCKHEPDIISVTHIIKTIDDSFVYLGTGCDSGYREILVHQNGKWIETAKGQGGLSCVDADTYKIPKALVHVDGEVSSDTCYTASNGERALKY